jgi:hypothetical protein
MVLANRPEGGSVLVLVFIAIAMFAALSFAVSQSFRGNGADFIEQEKAKMAGVADADCITSVMVALERLKLRGCQRISYAEDGSNPVTPDGSCSVYHPRGGGVNVCSGFDSDAYCAGKLEALTIGQACGRTVYAGKIGAARLYVRDSDLGGLPWNHGINNTDKKDIVTNSQQNGKINTDILLAQTDATGPYKAAIACRALGPEWYLPSRAEYQVMFQNYRRIGGFNDTGTGPGQYWTSLGWGINSGITFNFKNGGNGSSTKYSALSVRCARRYTRPAGPAYQDSDFRRKFNRMDRKRPAEGDRRAVYYVHSRGFPASNRNILPALPNRINLPVSQRCNQVVPVNQADGLALRPIHGGPREAGQGHDIGRVCVVVEHHAHGLTDHRDADLARPALALDDNAPPLGRHEQIEAPVCLPFPPDYIDMPAPRLECGGGEFLEIVRVHPAQRLETAFAFRPVCPPQAAQGAPQDARAGYGGRNPRDEREGFQ